jgi:hypothetical protein
MVGRESTRKVLANAKAYNPFFSRNCKHTFTGLPAVRSSVLCWDRPGDFVACGVLAATVTT